MTASLEPELAAAYVRELSADVSAVVVLDAEGVRLAGPEASEAPARRLADGLPEGGMVATSEGTAWVARTPERTLVAVAAPGAGPGPTALDVAAAIGAAAPPAPVAEPSEALRTAVQDVIAAT